MINYLWLDCIGLIIIGEIFFNDGISESVDLNC